MENDVADRAPNVRLRRVALAVALIVALDQVTKSIAVATLTRGEPVRVIGSLVRFELTSNSGGSFSMLQGSTPLLAVAAIAVSVYLIYLVHTADDAPTVAALTLLLSGAFGNLGDRIFRSPAVLRGEVIDFIEIPHWPNFNVADMAITFGGVLLAVRLLTTGGSPHSADEVPAVEVPADE